MSPILTSFKVIFANASSSLLQLVDKRVIEKNVRINNVNLKNFM
jgi:hypothetical protein